MTDLLLANLVPLFAVVLALIGVLVFRLSRRDRPLAAVFVVLGALFLALWFGAEEGAPPAMPSPAAGITATPVLRPPRP